jgi:hypothetical protein
MNIVKLTDISKSQRFSDNKIVRDHLIRSINIRDESVGKLIDALSESYDKEELLKVLNSINNQGISDIDMNRYSYWHRGEKLKFAELSTAEKAFLIAYAACKTKTKVYLCKDIRQLTKTTLKTFFRLFKDSSFVDVAYEDDIEKSFLNSMFKEV